MSDRLLTQEDPNPHLSPQPRLRSGRFSFRERYHIDTKLHNLLTDLNNKNKFSQTPLALLALLTPVKSRSRVYSHSMVEGGLEVMSYTTRFTAFTSLQILALTSWT